MAEPHEIKAIYNNGVARRAFSSFLDHFINMRAIFAFCGSDGWISINSHISSQHLLAYYLCKELCFKKCHSVVSFF
jgi:hypothetical protein